jgi:hypothetical protein
MFCAKPAQRVPLERKKISPGATCKMFRWNIAGASLHKGVLCQSHSAFRWNTKKFRWVLPVKCSAGTLLVYRFIGASYANRAIRPIKMLKKFHRVLPVKCSAGTLLVHRFIGASYANGTVRSAGTHKKMYRMLPIKCFTGTLPVQNRLFQ